MKVQLFLVVCFAVTGSGQISRRRHHSSTLTSVPTSRLSTSSSSTSTSVSTSRLSPSSSSTSTSTSALRPVPSPSIPISVTSSSINRSSSVSKSLTSSTENTFYTPTSPVIASQASGTGGRDSTAGATAGIVVGVIVGVILIAAVVFLVLWLTRRKRHQESKSAAATVAKDYQYGEFPPVQRLPSEHHYAVIDETDGGSTNGGFMTSQYDNVASTSRTDDRVSGISNEAMTSATDTSIDSNSRGSISEITLVENTLYE